MTAGSSDSPARLEARRLLRLRHLSGRRPPRMREDERSFRAIVAYEGADWCGWQRQPASVSVAEMLEAALEAATGAPVVVTGAGRTDAGVHAVGQAVVFRSATDLPADAMRHICLQILPPSIRVATLEEAPEGWNPQRDCVRKLYRYRILESAWPAPAQERVAWRLRGPLDLDALRAAAEQLVGTHDFRALRNDPGPARRDEETVRTIESLTVERRLDLLHLDVVGPGFLYMMVRNVTSALVEVGEGRRSPAWVGELLASRDRRLGPPPAPAHGLTLERIEYADGFGGAPRG